ncbi:MAG: M48 family metallopeptidase [Fibrobacter sp.]|uniref:M48 family metallopeptidase n=1 Tax=Fibrobacter sp. TaxID=35828 RepID=UPI0025BDD965|nr:SprT family zinc-dependent metalloprotease [Fibrobacter sp.]MBQ3714942.1 M48 family metallopeptidase [Fibrobacter sp.]MBQ7078204.1 M48 family metallopeptidase [Fibrobacter sp.]
MNELNVVKYGDREIVYEVEFCRRKTLEISVMPDSAVQVRAPQGAKLEAIAQKVQKKAPWIVEKQDWFAKFPKAPPPRQYLGGETHLYLGRRYRLKIEKDKERLVKIDGGFIRVISADVRPATVKKLLDEWLRERAKVQFENVFLACMARFSHSSKSPRLQIRDMKTRWGSLSKGGILTLNTKLIAAPKECIEYVVVHELCHLKYPNHDKKFYRLLETRMPDWQRRKLKLENMQV